MSTKTYTIEYQTHIVSDILYHFSIVYLYSSSYE